jgi:hypothetical protein
MLQTIQNALSEAPVECRLIDFSDQERWPLLEVTLSPVLTPHALDICRSLRDGKPPIYVDHTRVQEGTMGINPLCLDATQAETLVSRFLEELHALKS